MQIGKKQNIILAQFYLDCYCVCYYIRGQKKEKKQNFQGITAMSVRRVPDQMMMT